MVQVPRLRNYEKKIPSGVEWTEALSLEVLIDFINADISGRKKGMGEEEAATLNETRALMRGLVDWLSTDHEGFIGYDDERFDAINRAAFKSLLDKRMLDEDFAGLFSIFKLEADEESPTLSALLAGNADEFQMDIDLTSDENRALIGDLIATELIMPQQGAIFNFVDMVQQQFGKNTYTEEQIIGMIKNRDSMESAIQSAQSMVERLISDSSPGFIIQPYLKSITNDNKVSRISLVEVLGNLFGDEYKIDDKRYRRSRDSKLVEDKSNKELTEEEWIQELSNMEPNELVGELNHGLKIGFRDKLVKSGLFKTFKEYDGLNKIYNQIDLSLNQSTLPSLEEFKTPKEVGNIGMRKTTIDLDELIDWVIANHGRDLQQLAMKIASNQEETHELTIPDWNPAEISGIPHNLVSIGTKTTKRKMTASNKVKLLDKKKTKRGAIFSYLKALRRDRDENFSEEIRSQYNLDETGVGGIFDGITEFYSTLKDAITKKISANPPRRDRYEQLRNIISQSEEILSDISTTDKGEEILNDPSLANDVADEMGELVLIIDTIREQKQDDEEAYRQKDREPTGQEIDTEIAQGLESVDFDDTIYDTGMAIKNDIENFISVLENHASSNLEGMKELAEEEYKIINQVLFTEGEGEARGVAGGIKPDFTDINFEAVRARKDLTASIDFLAEQLYDTQEMQDAFFDQIVQEEEAGKINVEAIESILTGFKDQNFMKNIRNNPQALSEETKRTLAKFLFYPVLYRGSIVGNENNLVQSESAPYSKELTGRLKLILEKVENGFEISFVYEVSAEVKIYLGSDPANFMGQTPSGMRVGTTSLTPSGKEKISRGKFKSLLNTSKKAYMEKLLNKLMKLDSVIGGN